MDKNEGDTPRVSAGQWNLENEIPNLGFIVLRVSGLEVDTPGLDDVFETFELFMTLDQAALVAANNANRYGLLEEFSNPSATEFADSVWHV